MWTPPSGHLSAQNVPASFEVSLLLTESNPSQCPASPVRRLKAFAQEVNETTYNFISTFCFKIKLIFRILN